MPGLPSWVIGTTASTSKSDLPPYVMVVVVAEVEVVVVVVGRVVV